MAGDRVRGLQCSTCNRKVNKYDEGLTCVKCSGFVHLTCSNISVEQFNEMRGKKLDKQWECGVCKSPTSESMATNDCVKQSDNDKEHNFMSGISSSLEKKIDKVLRGQDKLGGMRDSLLQLITDLKTENSELKAIVNNQSGSIAAIRDEIINLSSLVSQQQILIQRLSVSEPQGASQETAENYASVCDGSTAKKINKSSIPSKNNAANIHGNLGESSQRSKSDTGSGLTHKRAPLAKGNNAPSNKLHNETQATVVVSGGGNSTSSGAESRVECNNIDGFKQVTYRKRSTNTIIGKRTDGGNLAAVEAKSWIFISRLQPSTTVENVRDYARGCGIDIVDCERLVIRSQEVSAFKISVPRNLDSKVLSEDTWPINTIVRRYRRRLNFQEGPATPIQT